MEQPILSQLPPVYIRRVASIHPQGTADDAPYLRACEPDYKGIIANAALRRRMSHLVKMGVACGLECLGDLPSEQVDGIITATGLGCLADTEKFLNQLIDHEEQLLNPTPFIQSTFNTIGAQIALLRQIHTYNMTYVHRALSFESALLDALLMLAEGSHYVLVGAADETTETSHILLQRLGVLKQHPAGEGAHFFLLSREAGTQPLAALVGIDTCTGTLTAEAAEHRIARLLQMHGLDRQAVCRLRDEKEGGEYPTASAYALWKAVTETHRAPHAEPYRLIESHSGPYHHSFILIRKYP